MLRSIYRTATRSNIINIRSSVTNYLAPFADQSKQKPKAATPAAAKGTPAPASTPASSTPASSTPAQQNKQKQPTLGDKPFILTSAQIKQQLPEVYTVLQKQAQQLQQHYVKDHHAKFQQLKQRITPENAQRVQKLNQLLQGLTFDEINYLNMKVALSIQKNY